MAMAFSVRGPRHSTLPPPRRFGQPDLVPWNFVAPRQDVPHRIPRPRSGAQFSAARLTRRLLRATSAAHNRNLQPPAPPHAARQWSFLCYFPAQITRGTPVRFRTILRWQRRATGSIVWLGLSSTRQPDSRGRF